MIWTNEFPHYNTTFFYYYIGVERTIIDLDSDTNNGFINIDKLLLDKQQKNIIPKGIAKKMVIRFESSILAAFNRLTKGSTQGKYTLFSNLAATSC